ncbi:MAG: D-alanyl-D-alanine carboxypeptidase [Firmicutes bacterium]|nr:D-alanyl-D-alanine carboxypeptidase [Bacillota bacterium]
MNRKEQRMRRRRRKRLLSVITVLLALAVICNIWYFANRPADAPSSKSQKQASEVHDQKKEKARALKQLDLNPSDFFSDHMIVKNCANGEILFEKAADEQTRPASLTKMMTALVAIEHTTDFQERVTIPHEIYTYLNGSGIAVAGFGDGENPTVDDLLYGALYKSGAECCLTLAQKVAGSEAAFVEMMNEKAGEIGMKNTTFGNCVGLDNPACWTTARDLLILTEYALKNQHFREIFASYSYPIEPTNQCSRTRVIRNAAVKRFGSDRAGVFGGKLGNTTQAQLCLSAIAQIEGQEYLFISTHAPRTQLHPNSHVEDARVIYKEIAKQVE